MRFLDEHMLQVARGAPRERIGKAERRREGQDADRIRPGDPGRKGRERRPQHISMRVAPRRHAPGRLRRKLDRFRNATAGLLDPRPKAAHGAELGNGQELVGIGDQEKAESRAGPIEAPSVALQGAQIGDAGRQREGELLSFARAGLMRRTPVDARETPSEPLRPQAFSRSP